MSTQQILGTLYPQFAKDCVVLMERVAMDMPYPRLIIPVSGLRTMDEQASLYAQGRTKPGKIVTNAKPGHSLHNFGLACDFAFIVDGKISWDDDLPWKTLYDHGKDLELIWGGNFLSIKDRPHVEWPAKIDLAEMRRLYDLGGLNKVWAAL